MTVCATPIRSRARVSWPTSFCIPPSGSNVAPRPMQAAGGTSKTEAILATRRCGAAG